MMARLLLWSWMDGEGTMKPRISLRGYKHHVVPDLLLSVLAFSEVVELPSFCPGPAA